MWSQHPDIAEAWSHGKSSVTGKKEFKPKNKGLPMKKSTKPRYSRINAKNKKD